MTPTVQHAVGVRWWLAARRAFFWPASACGGEVDMTGVWALAALWLGLALIASLLSIWLRVSTALSEIVVGIIAQLIIGAAVGSAILGTDESWVKFLSGIGAIVLTFLAGTELDPAVFKRKWKEATAVGLASFFFTFIGWSSGSQYGRGWAGKARSLPAG